MTRLITPAIAAIVAFIALVAAPPVSAAPSFAPFEQATIRPGVITTTAGTRCTANFIYAGPGDELYLGQSAHCSGTDGSSETNGCGAGSLPLGTNVTIEGATRPGKLAYNSWLQMQSGKESDSDACAYNDFALVRIDPADAGRVNPSMPFFGGPVGLTDRVPRGETVFSYGRSPLRLGIEVLSPKQGASLGQSAGGWLHTVLTLTPGVPGDSGSGFVDRSGRAFGVLSTLEFLPLPLSNGVTDLSRALSYANDKAGLRARLVNGTDRFRAGIVRLGSPRSKLRLRR